MKLPRFRVLLNTSICLVAALSVANAVAQTYNPTSNDTLRLNSGGNGGSAQTPNFFAAVAAAVGGGVSCAATAPVVGTGFGTNAAITASTAVCTFQLAVGSTASSNGTITLPAAVHGWHCSADDLTTKTNAIFSTAETATTTNVVTLDGYQVNGAVGNWVANDTVAGSCTPY